jgi:hypothetical protein
LHRTFNRMVIVRLCRVNDLAHQALTLRCDGITEESAEYDY